MERGQVLAAERLGISFRGHLAGVREGKLLAQRTQNSHQFRDGQQRGGPAPEKDRTHLGATRTQNRGSLADLGADPLEVGLLPRAGSGSEFGRSVGVEVAVTAPRGAVRHVDVQAQRPARHLGERGGGQARRRVPVGSATHQRARWMTAGTTPP